MWLDLPTYPHNFVATLGYPQSYPCIPPDCNESSRTTLNAKRAETPVTTEDLGSCWTALHVDLVPKAGLEPARISPHAPQTCASTNSATWAKNSPYLAFLAGEVGAAAVPVITEDRGRAWRIANAIEVTTKATKKPVVSL